MTCLTEGVLSTDIVPWCQTQLLPATVRHAIGSCGSVLPSRLDYARMSRLCPCLRVMETNYFRHAEVHCTSGYVTCNQPVTASLTESVLMWSTWCRGPESVAAGDCPAFHSPNVLNHILWHSVPCLFRQVLFTGSAGPLWPHLTTTV